MNNDTNFGVSINLNTLQIITTRNHQFSDKQLLFSHQKTNKNNVS